MPFLGLKSCSFNDVSSPSPSAARVIHSLEVLIFMLDQTCNLTPKIRIFLLPHMGIKPYVTATLSRH